MLCEPASAAATTTPAPSTPAPTTPAPITPAPAGITPADTDTLPLPAEQDRYDLAGVAEVLGEVADGAAGLVGHASLAQPVDVHVGLVGGVENAGM